ncbi:hypothetical protein M011DRAFT_466784 [Sporormia fimetaria CBS 119925]|uniref:histone deacetylase n=1 Tax=Sporormia fimetaria CBS 119925 TaxID=1340428 RepID=A0A6A6VFM5_9PLEO|nr:hypothetical protein M011DRAFT_466784 [Sporormia fimetaria CBS 119925]
MANWNDDIDWDVSSSEPDASSSGDEYVEYNEQQTSSGPNSDIDSGFVTGSVRSAEEPAFSPQSFSAGFSQTPTPRRDKTWGRFSAFCRLLSAACCLDKTEHSPTDSGNFNTSFTHTFNPTASDIQHWRNQGCPPPFVKPVDPSLAKTRSRTRGVQSAMAQSGCIVEEYSVPNGVYGQNFQAFKTLTDAEKMEVTRKEAEEYGLERPRGYTVSFHYNPHVEYHHFGSSHPMKPWRLTLTKQLVLAYGLEYTMDLYTPRPASFDEMALFHDRDYLSFLQQITPQNMHRQEDILERYSFGGESNDCPVFEGLWNYVSLYSGASMHAAQNLLNHQSDIAINWSGGLHHAKKGAASGFCYVNDIVLAIQHLLTQHQRVLYIDIDVHHGDGVEAAFESTDRVFTLSYHKFGQDRFTSWPFFPGTGDITDTGPSDPTNRGKAHALNIPLEDGIDDDQYKWLFKTVTGAVVDKYQPTAIVLQSGADSLGGDRLGRFNLNIKAHGFCVETVKNYGRPLLLIGGGGYTPRNVARTWCHETAVCVGASLHNDLPTHIPYIMAFQGEENGGGILYPELHNTKRHENNNTTQKLNKIVERAMESLRYLEGAPSVVINTMGIAEEQLMRMREEVDRQLEEEREDTIRNNQQERLRKKMERNTGGRSERGLR